MSEEYYLLFKTADAEKRAWKNLQDIRKEAIFPIVELSRGRKIAGKGKGFTAERLRQTPGIYGFERNWLTTCALMEPCQKFFLDLTREPSLSCFELDEVANSSNGYERWTSFVLDVREKFGNVRPTLIVNPGADDDEADYEKDLRQQFETFSQSFDEIAYRVAVIEDPDFLYDLIAIKDEVQKFEQEGGKFYVILDHEYVRPNNGYVHAARTSEIISAVREELPDVHVICLATSFPKSVTDIGDEEHDRFRVEEMYLFRKIRENDERVLYGDYGSINPIRNDEVVMARGWRPRIDFVSRTDGMSVYYFREKRNIVGRDEVKNKNILAPYSIHYASVARKVKLFHPFFEVLSKSWGVDEIEKASQGDVPSNSPSHWISVRMEVHIIQVLRELGVDPVD
ncbi:hypothetical protein BWR17_15675 [Phaeobacter inhibens]|uniref:beta family protein n=1 Tax=Phaeobacter inhibens TaxID=221822 RepID=UPI000971BE89|nr:hypothetical protein [Phaeobacter inhibens]APX17129.1 hypothetical protein BWR17_15675 [Phaeobacter inhibens]